MRFGVILPNVGPAAAPDTLDAAAETAARLEWSSLWVTDHMLVPPGDEAVAYGTALEALTTLAWVCARHAELRIGTSVVVPAMRDAPQLAKELATLDVLSGGRLTVGVGVGDRSDLAEWSNLGKAARMSLRGAYLDEAIALWRHLWSGSREPFRGTFHELEAFTFLPLPPQGGALPILSGGRSAPAVTRAATLADGYHASQTGPDDLRDRLPSLIEQARAAGRGRPQVSIRARVRFDRPKGPVYAFSGSPRDMVADVEAFARLGVQEIVVTFETPDASALVSDMERFDAEVVRRWRQDQREREEAVREEYSM